MGLFNFLNSGSNQYIMKEEKGNYVFYKRPKSIVTSPGSKPLIEKDKEVAERILNDLNMFGPDYMGPDSILPWVYTYIDNFEPMGKDAVIKMLSDCFLITPDWTYAIKNEGLRGVFGTEKARTKEIREWMKELNTRQLTAACCIGNAYHSINVAYIFARYISNYSNDILEKQIDELAALISTLMNQNSHEDVREDFRTFKLYYGNPRNNKIEDKEVPWRDKNGKLSCQIDLCGDSCNPKCPIHLKTIGDEHLVRGDMKGSIPYYRDAIKTAEDFDEAWNNLANAYAQLNMHGEAFDAFRHAYEGSNRKRGSALYSMAVASKLMAKYDEALKYCDEYDKRFKEYSTTDLRRSILELKEKA